MPLSVALESACDPSVIDILSSATFTADNQLQTDVFDHSGDHFVLAIWPECSESTVRLWIERGAQPVISTDDRNGRNLHLMLDSKISVSVKVDNAPAVDLAEWKRWLEGNTEAPSVRGNVMVSTLTSIEMETVYRSD